MMLAWFDARDWVLLGIGGVVIPTVAWLLKEVLSLRRDMVKIQTNCEAHQKMFAQVVLDAKDIDEALKKALEQQAQTLQRLDRNMVRVCQNAGIEFEHP